MTGVRCGLDYGVLFRRLDQVATDPDHWQQLYQDIRVLEVAAMNRMAETA